MGFVLCFGLFWRRDQVVWNPGTGTRGGCRLLGHQGERLPGVRVADFWNQTGIYILHCHHGVFYAGRTFRSIGNRLKAHHNSYYDDQWDKFSWFGFRKVLAKKENGLRQLGKKGEYKLASPNKSIKDSEALIMRAMNPPANERIPDFAYHDEWFQIPLAQIDHFLGLVR